MTQRSSAELETVPAPHDRGLRLSFWLPDGWIVIPAEQLAEVTDAEARVAAWAEAHHLDARLTAAVLDAARQASVAPVPATVACCVMEDDDGVPAFVNWTVTLLDDELLRAEIRIPDEARRRALVRDQPIGAGMSRRFAVVQHVISAGDAGPHVLLTGTSPRDDLFDDLVEVFDEIASRVTFERVAHELHPTSISPAGPT